LASGGKLQIHPRLELQTPDREGPEVTKERVAADFERRRLHVALTPQELDKRILAIYREARTLSEETGSSTLFLALGMLEWYETTSSEEPRRAPILLIPVELERRAVGESYRLSLADDEPRLNVTLLEKIR